MDELQRVALERNARNFAKERIKNFKANPWHGPVTDAIEMAADLHNKSCKTSDGQMRIYISYAPHGPELLHLAAKEHREAFLLACRVVASRISAERRLPPRLRDFAAHAIIAPHEKEGGLLSQLIPPRKSGPKKWDDWHAGTFIRGLASSLRKEFGILPTENDENAARKASRLPSSMAIISEESRQVENTDFRPVTPNTVKRWVTGDHIGKTIDGAVNELGPWFSEWIEHIHSGMRHPRPAAHRSQS